MPVKVLVPREIGLQIFMVQVKAYVTIKVAVLTSRISISGTPYLLCRFRVASKGDRAGRCPDRAVYAFLRYGRGVQQAVAFKKEIVDASILHLFIQAWRIAAFRQPNAGRFCIKILPECTDPSAICVRMLSGSEICRGR